MQSFLLVGMCAAVTTVTFVGFATCLIFFC
jgi:hypothetical protein